MQYQVLFHDTMAYGTHHHTVNVKFQNIAPVNGRPLTADDVRLVYERYQKEGVSRALFSNVDTMKAIDPATFQVKLKKPQPSKPHYQMGRKSSFLMSVDAARPVRILLSRLVRSGIRAVRLWFL